MHFVMLCSSNLLSFIGRYFLLGYKTIERRYEFRFYLHISCQTTNYQFFVKYCRYFLDTLTLSYSGIECQIEILKNAVLKIKKGKSKPLDAPFSVGIFFEYLKD
jgi:hypothetical protein